MSTPPPNAAVPATPGLPSIQQRLSQVVRWTTLGWGLAVSLLVWLMVHQQVDEIMDNALRESAEVLYGTISTHALAMPGDDGPLGSEHPQVLPAPPHREHLVWQLVAPGGRVLLRSHQAPDPPLGVPGQAGFSEVAGQWRVCALVDAPGGRTLFVAQPLHRRLATQVQATAVTAGITMLAGLAAAAWLRRRTRRELQPLAALSQAVARYDPMHAVHPLDAVDRAELLPLRGAVVGLGQRLARHVANERAVAAHAAHALRTPLAGLVAQLATAQKLSPPDAPPALPAALHSARGAADRLRRVVGALITLFRSGAELQWVAVDLDALLASLPAAGLQLRREGAEARLWADADLLAAALANLLDNAARCGARQVRLAWHSGADGGTLVVADDGPGASAERVAALQAALDAQDYESGTGLGLMLADLVARAHGGRLGLGTPPSGFEARLRLGPPPPGHGGMGHQAEQADRAG